MPNTISVTGGGDDTVTFTISGTVGECTLSTEQIPRHTHTGTYSALTESADKYYAEAGYLFGPGNATVNLSATGNNQPHSHPFLETVSVVRFLPPFFALAYIMYVGD